MSIRIVQYQSPPAQRVSGSHSFSVAMRSNRSLQATAEF